MYAAGIQTPAGKSIQPFLGVILSHPGNNSRRRVRFPDEQSNSRKEHIATSDILHWLT